MAYTTACTTVQAVILAFLFSYTTNSPLSRCLGYRCFTDLYDEASAYERSSLTWHFKRNL